MGIKGLPLTNPEYGEIEFYIGKQKIAINFDTCIWISRIFKEENHSDPSKQEKGKITQFICSQYPSSNEEYLILIDTIAYEFREIISYKAMNFGETIRNCLIRAVKRIENGERKFEVIKEIGNEIRCDTSINLLYDYFEQKGMGFANLFSEDIRLDFFRTLVAIPQKFDLLFQQETRKCVKRYVKDRIIMWIMLNRKTFDQFQKKSPKIGKKDRFHILGCILLCLIESRNVKFVTHDNLLMNCSNNFEDFFSNNLPKLEKQVEKLLEADVS